MNYLEPFTGNNFSDVDSKKENLEAYKFEALY